MFSTRFKDLRLQKGHSQSEIAKLLNVGPSTISMWESDKRTPDKDMLIKIAALFTCTVDYLLGSTNTKDNKVYEHEGTLIEINKSYPYELTPNEVAELIKKLKAAHFDVNGLINEIKEKNTGDSI